MGSSPGGDQEPHESAAAMDSSAAAKQQMSMGMPTWLNSALSRQTSGSSSHHPGGAASSEHPDEQPNNSWSVNNPSTSSYTNWLSGARATSQEGTAELLLNEKGGGGSGGSIDHEGGGGGGGGSAAELVSQEDCARYQNAGLKADIVTHPLYEQLLEAHVACLRIATPVDQLSRIDGQISQCHHVIAKYSILANHQLLCGSTKEELDHFMAHYVMLLKSFKEQLQHHVRVHAKEAVMACWELEQSLISLTGAAPGEGSGATMSDDEEDQQSDQSDFWQDNLGFGPLIPTETERTLMERVRQELKHELKQGYRARIVDVREEILRKRRAGKLPGDTTSVLKAWWHAHSKWPYPTEDEKARLVQETGLELKQINNWFINQRKRNWHHHPSSSTSTSKSKCKRG